MSPVGPLAGLTPVDKAKIVHDVAAGQDEHTLGAQFVQLHAEVEVIVEG